jgi:molecular chaperone DnaK
MAKDNRSLGKFHLDGIMPAPRGIPQIEVTFDIDANGILSVSAKDKATNKENKIRIEGGSQLSKEEIERMKREAEEFAEADKLEREKVEKVNAADSMIFQTEKQIKEFDEKLTDEDKTSLNEALTSLKKSHSEQNLESIETDMKNLSETWSKISERIYSETKTEEPMNENQDESQPQDTEFEEVK